MCEAPKKGGRRMKFPISEQIGNKLELLRRGGSKSSHSDEMK
jgi:hypothetical protein